MADLTTIKNEINTDIVTNGVNAITADVLNDVLIDMCDAVEAAVQDAEDYSQDMANEVNISRLYPTGGTNGGDTYKISTAISKVPNTMRVEGCKVTFISDGADSGLESGSAYTFQYQGSSWAAANFKRIDALLVEGVRSDMTDLVRAIYGETITNTISVAANASLSHSSSKTYISAKSGDVLRVKVESTQHSGTASLNLYNSNGTGAYLTAIPFNIESDVVLPYDITAISFYKGAVASSAVVTITTGIVTETIQYQAEAAFDAAIEISTISDGTLYANTYVNTSYAATSSTNFVTRVFPNDGYYKVKMQLSASYGNFMNIIAIGFLSTDTIAQANFINAVASNGSSTIFVGDVPNGCNYIVVSMPKAVTTNVYVEKPKEVSVSEDTSEDYAVTMQALLLREKIKEDIPYYLSTSQSPADYETGYLDGKIASVPKDGMLQFMFYTDTHWSESEQKSLYLTNYVKNRLGVKNIFFGGDGLDGEMDKYLAANQLSDFSESFFSTFGRDALWIQGNHDTNGVMYINGYTSISEIISDEQVYKRTIGLTTAKIVYDEKGLGFVDDLTTLKSEADRDELREWMRMHYYIDDDENKTRYIVMETNDVGYSTCVILNPSYTDPNITAKNTPYVGYMQIPFMYETLMSTPDGYNVVLCGHWFSKTQGSTSQLYLDNFWHYKNKDDGSFNFGGITSTVVNEFVHFYLNSGDTFHTLYSQNGNNIGKCLAVSGHIHADAAYVFDYVSGTRTYEPYENFGSIQDSAILSVVVTTDCDAKDEVTQDTYDSSTGRYKWQMTAGTITEHAFDVITLKESQVICTRFGAGQDRTYNYK